MFNKRAIEALKNELNNLKSAIFKPQSSDSTGLFQYMFIDIYQKKLSLEERLTNRISNLEKKLDLLLNHLKLKVETKNAETIITKK